MVGTRFGSPSATVWGSDATSGQVAATATNIAPAEAIYGPGAVEVTGAPGVVGTSAGHLATYLGIGSLAALVIIRQSLPK